jgi:hypothetical protein
LNLKIDGHACVLKGYIPQLPFVWNNLNKFDDVRESHGFVVLAVVKNLALNYWFALATVLEGR